MPVRKHKHGHTEDGVCRRCSWIEDAGGRIRPSYGSKEENAAAHSSDGKAWKAGDLPERFGHWLARGAERSDLVSNLLPFVKRTFGISRWPKCRTIVKLGPGGDRGNFISFSVSHRSKDDGR